ncbi:hypothetical protein [Streptomyces sp. Wb2n-11]|uniref:hypothetical protein n=1 Tax=Streptomyces sp. Wb2n-11 TaxID=1030533 RepID=UPI00350E5761
MGDRQVINSTVCAIRTEASRRDPPECYVPWKTVHLRFRRYAVDGVLCSPAPFSRPKPAPTGPERLAGPDRFHRCPSPAARRGHQPKGGSADGTNRTVTPSAGPERTAHRGSSRVRRPWPPVRRPDHPDRRHDGAPLCPQQAMSGRERLPSNGRGRRRPALRPPGCDGSVRPCAEPRGREGVPPP